MSSRERRKQLEQEHEERMRAAERERLRRDALDMWSRIEESDASHDVKDILHRMAQALGLED